MAPFTFTNFPITFKLTATFAGNKGNLYDYTLNTSLTNYIADWNTVSTPIWNALSGNVGPSVHWVVSVVTVPFPKATPLLVTTGKKSDRTSTDLATPPGLQNHRARVNGTCGRVEITAGQQSFATLVLRDFDTARILATPVV